MLPTVSIHTSPRPEASFPGRKDTTMFEDNCYYYDHGDQDFLCNFPTLEELEESVRLTLSQFYPTFKDDCEYDPSHDVRLNTFIVDLRHYNVKPFPDIASCSVYDSKLATRDFYRCYHDSLCFNISDLVCEHNPDVHAMASAVLDYLRTKIEDEIERASEWDAIEQAELAEEEAYEQSHYTNVVIEFTKDMHSARCANEIRLFGRLIAEYNPYKHKARAGRNLFDEGVGFLRGLPVCSGSTKRWALIIPAGTVIELPRVDRDLLSRELPTVQAEHPDLRITVKDKPERLDPIVLKRAALESQKSSLLAQVAQIDAELATLSH